MVLDGTSREESCSLLLEVVDACCALNSIQASVVAKHAEADVLDFLRALKGLPVHALTVDCYRILPAQGGGRWLASLAGFPLRRLVLFGVNMAHIQAEDFLAFQTVEELRLDEVSLPLPQYASFLKSFPRLHFLTLHGGKIGPGLAEIINNIPRCLRTLSIDIDHSVTSARSAFSKIHVLTALESFEWWPILGKDDAPFDTFVTSLPPSIRLLTLTLAGSTFEAQARTMTDLLSAQDSWLPYLRRLSLVVIAQQERVLPELCLACRQRGIELAVDAGY
jgi:hypothetical protein